MLVREWASLTACLLSLIFAYGQEILPLPESIIVKIVGGHEVSIVDYPYQVSLRMYDQHICGGSLIANHYILTAAHCVLKYLDKIEFMGVGMGHSRLHDRQLIRPVDSVLIHPGFRSHDPVINDIAIVKLRNSAEVNNVTRKIIEIAKKPPPPGELCTITGWGSLIEPPIGKSAHTVNQLRAADIPIVSPRICSKLSGVNESYICAGGYQEGIDSCQRMVEVHCNGWVFHSNFDSGNLGKVEAVLPPGVTKNSCESSESISETPDFEFNVWTRPDCAGTEFENGNRTWFYFGMKGGQPFSTVKINIVNLNKQCKMYAQGMTPVYRILPGKPQWERIKDKPSFNMEDRQFTVSFIFRFGDTLNQTVYFAFTYPYTYSDLINHLTSVDLQLKSNCYKDSLGEPKQDDIYYHRELLAYSFESRRIDLITISSYHGISKIREPRIPHLFPDENTPRPLKFLSPKKVIFLSARVHPGETPSSFVMAGMINFLLSKDDSIASTLRRHFVFKLIPMLNPDGVFRGNYRTDTRGVNLNRVYNNPSPHFHPSIYGARAMIRYYHHGFVVPEDECFEKVFEEKISGLSLSKSQTTALCTADSLNVRNIVGNDGKSLVSVDAEMNANDYYKVTSSDESGLFLYIDMHGHTSKKGIFMYGNHFENINMKVECMLFPKLITLYSQHFLFDSCNFTEKNMYVKDRRDGSSREGCGRVAVYKATGLVRSYTLECNYNTGKNLNLLPPPYREPMDRRSQSNLIVPPKYTPTIYEEAGKSVLSALLDLVGMHPNTRLVNSVYRSLSTVRDVLRKRLIMDEMSDKEEALEKRRFSGRITARKIRVNKEGRPRIAGKGEPSRLLRRNTVPQESSNSLSARKPPEKRKKKKKKLKEEGPSSARKRIEKKCVGAENSRRFSLEHKRKKLKPK